MLQNYTILLPVNIRDVAKKAVKDRQHKAYINRIFKNSLIFEKFCYI